MNYEALRWVIEQAPVSGAAWQILTVIAYRADRSTGECYLARRTLAAEARVSTGTVHRILEELIGAGILELVIVGSGRRSNTYRINTTASGSMAEPQKLSTGLSTGNRSESMAEPQESVVAQSASRSGSIRGPVVAQPARSPYRNEGKTEGKSFEGQPTVVTQEPAAALAPTGAAAQQQGDEADEVPRLPDGRRNWKLIVNPHLADQPSPNGRDPPPGRRAELH